MEKVRSFITFVLILSIYSTQSFGSNWVKVATDKSGSSTYYIDASSIRLTSDRKYSFWVKEAISKPGEHNFYVLKDVSEIRYNYIEDCDNNSSKLQGKTLYNDSGGVYTFTPDLYGSFGFVTIVPDSIGESFYRFVCGGQ